MAVIQTPSTWEYYPFWQSFDLDRLKDIPSESGELSGCCPFHGDANPSLFMNVNTGFWKCFGCDSGGTAKTFLIRWLQEVRGVDVGSLDFDVEYRRRRGEAAPPDNSEIARWCALLWESPTALAYIAQRGIDTEANKAMLRRYEFGFDGTWITLPVRTPSGKIATLKKLRASPEASSKAKSLAGFDAALWPVDQLMSVDDRPVIVCEGEWDCLCALLQGQRAVTGTAGAGTWRDEWSCLFSGKTVYICYDGDDAGRKGALNVAASLRRHARDVRIANLPDTEDVNSLYQQGIPIASLLETAQQFSDPGPRLLTYPQLVQESLDDLSLPWLVDGLLRPGWLAVLGGKAKAGKTSFTFHMLKALLNGEDFLGRTVGSAIRPWAVYANYEMTNADLVRLYQDVFGRGTVPKTMLTLEDPFRPLDPTRIGAWLAEQQEALGYGPGILVIDSATAAFGLAGDAENQAGNVAFFLRTLREEVCKKLRWTVLILHHERKSGNGDPLDLAGSREWYAAPDVVMTFSPDPKRATGALDGILRVSGRLPPCEDINVRMSRTACELPNGTASADNEVLNLVWVALDQNPGQTTEQISLAIGRSVTNVRRVLQWNPQVFSGSDQSGWFLGGLS